MKIYFPQKPANILVMGEGQEKGRVKIGKWLLRHFSSTGYSVFTLINTGNSERYKNLEV